jgi:hypothetical protein
MEAASPLYGARIRAAGLFDPPLSAFLSNCVEEVQQDDHGNRNSESPEENAAHVQLRVFNVAQG